MNVGRRAFLQTMAAASVGGVSLDPISKLWVPKPKELVIPTFAGRTVQSVIDEQLELNELALQAAKLLAERILNSRAQRDTLMLREVMYQHAGHVRIESESAPRVEQSGYFQPNDTRIVKTLTDRSFNGVGSQAQNGASMLLDGISGFDAFAPITAELRPGEPFSDDTLVGFATDPASGLTVRVLRFEVEGVRRGQFEMRHGATAVSSGTRTAFEVAAGRWRKRDRAGLDETYHNATKRQAALGALALLHILSDVETDESAEKVRG